MSEENKQRAEHSLLRLFSCNAVGNGVYVTSQWLTIVVIARYGSPEALGYYAFAQVIAVPVVTFSQLQLRWLLAANTVKHAPFASYLHVRLASTATAWCVIVIVAQLLDRNKSLVYLIALVGAVRCIDSVSDIYYGLLQRREDHVRIAASLVTNGVLTLTAVTLAMIVTADILVAAAASLLGSVVSLGVAATSSTRPTRAMRTGSMTARSIIAAGLPLGLVTLLIAANTMLPRYLLEVFSGPSELGVFAAVAYFVTPGQYFVSSMGQVGASRLSSLYGEVYRAPFWTLVAQMSSAAMTVGVLGVLGAVFFGRELLVLAYGPDYENAGGLLVLAMVGACCVYVASVFGYALTAIGCIRPQPIVLAITAAATTTASVVIIPAWGAAGAFCAVAGGAAIQMTMSALLLISQPVTPRVPEMPRPLPSRSPV